jgi:hypothetical protein
MSNWTEKIKGKQINPLRKMQLLWEKKRKEKVGRRKRENGKGNGGRRVGEKAERTEGTGDKVATM